MCLHDVVPQSEAVNRRSRDNEKVQRKKTNNDLQNTT
jgi:hypothetical protein